MSIDHSNQIVGPNYTITQFRDNMYKVVKFKNTIRSVSSLINKADKVRNSYENKLDQSLSRSRRMILEKGLCNNWQYFVSLTLDPHKWDRTQLHTFYKDFSQWLRNERKNGLEISYLFVPELHDDLESWHLHGFVSGNMQLVSFRDMAAAGHRLPSTLLKGNYYNWPAYQERYGFCSFGLIRDPIASAFYASKYVTKDSAKSVSEVGAHLYYCSQGLNIGQKVADGYGFYPELDQIANRDYAFCKVGYTDKRDGLEWCWGFAFDDKAPLPLFDSPLPSGSFMDVMQQLNFDI